MAKQTIDIGSAPNDGTGDPIRDAFDKANDNFDELYGQLDTDGTMAANSDAKVPSQKAVRTYVGTAVTGLLDFKGATDCSANPNYPAASKGDTYLVSVAGKIGGASGTDVEIGDVYLATADNAGGTEASVGSSWTVLQGNILTGGIATNLDDLDDVNAPTPSDGDVLTYDSGAGEWVSEAPSGGGGGSSFERTRVIPDTADFTLENAGTASMADSTYGIVLTTPTVATQVRFIRYTAGPPATPYSMIVRANPVSHTSTNGLYQMAVIIRNSSNGRLLIYSDVNGPAHTFQRFSAYSTFNANVLGTTACNMLYFLPWIRLRNDGTDIHIGRSPDGENWSEFTSDPLASYLTAAGGSADQIGFGMMMNGLGSTAVSIFQSFELV